MTINYKKGFTLIELLVVIAIIGILSSVVLASLNTARTKSRDARRVSDMKQLQLAFELFFDSCRSYPVQATQGGITGGLTAGSCPTGVDLSDFIAAIPTDPVGTTAYQYVGNATAYCVGADMEGTPPTPADTCATLDITTAGIDYKVGP